jgi:NAD(P)-dependent dehydrogenase (short-subunit alcohol dehydrogenase family)
MFAINTRAPFLLMQEAVRVMRREGNGGAIVNIVTMSSHGGQSKLTAYCASKGALATLTKNVAHAVRFDRIRVNGINIGWTATPNEHRIQMAEGQPEDWLVRAEAEQPMGRLIAPEDVANLTLFLLGPASGVMTGSVIDCDQMVMGAYE